MKKKSFRTYKSRRAPQRSGPRVIAFVAIAVLVLGAAGYLLASAFAPKTPPPVANVLDVSADMGGFSVKELRVQAGQPVTVRLTSLDNSHHTDGGGQHQCQQLQLHGELLSLSHHRMRQGSRPVNPRTCHRRDAALHNICYTDRIAPDRA